MRKYPALILFIIGSFIILLSLIFPQQSFAQNRLYQCSPAVDYATAIANCNSGPVDCVNPVDGSSQSAPDGEECARRAATWYSKQETKTLAAQ